MRDRRLSFALTGLSCLALLAPARARACGGCFGLPAAQSTVTGHRMAFAVSEERTVLWDQFQYDGEPEDFSWVLPVRPGAYVEASTDAWFETLEAVTQVRVSAPTLTCASASSTGCMGGDDEETSLADGSPRGGDDSCRQSRGARP